MQMSEKKKIVVRSAAGKLWSEEEEEKVKKLIQQGKSHKDIATEIGRTPLAVRIRCEKLAAIEIREGRDTSEVMKKYNVEAEKVSQHKLCQEPGCNKSISAKCIDEKYCKDHIKVDPIGKKTRVGKIWTNDEEKKLKELIEQEKSHKDISKEMGRTVKAIRLRCERLAAIEIRNGENSDTVIKKYNVDEDKVKKYLKKLCVYRGCNKDISKKSNTGNYCKLHLNAESSTADQLEQLRSRMSSLEGKIDKIMKHLRIKDE